MKKILLGSLLITSLVLGFQADLNQEKPLTTHTELGYIKTDGNTDTQTFNLDAKAKKTWGKHVGNIIVDAQYADDSGVTKKNKYLIELDYNYELQSRFAWTYLAGYKSDKFSNFNYQAYSGPGAQYKAIVSDMHNLYLEGNILYSIDELESGKDDKYAAYRAKAVYTWQVLKNLKFNQDLSFRGSLKELNNYFIFSKTAFTSKLSDMFSAGLSYKVDYVNEPGLKDNTDTTLTANLIIDY